MGTQAMSHELYMNANPVVDNFHISIETTVNIDNDEESTENSS